LSGTVESAARIADSSHQPDPDELLTIAVKQLHDDVTLV
jgi:hypothetical protein